MASGCATRITVSHLVPAAFDMSRYRTLAVEEPVVYEFSIDPIEDLSGGSPVILYSGDTPFIGRSIGGELAEKLGAKLQESSYFSPLFLAQGERADVPRLYSQGYTALLRPRISRIKGSQYIYAETKVGEQEPSSYALRQYVELSLVFTLIETATGNILLEKVMQGNADNRYELDIEDGPVIFAPPLQPLIQQQMNVLVDSFIDSLQPTRKVVSLSLLPNKPAVAAVEMAYQYSKEGLYQQALSLFELQWQQSRHLSSGYNAALIYEALGQREKALNLMQEVYGYYRQKKVAFQIERMQRHMKEHQRAQQQF